MKPAKKKIVGFSFLLLVTVLGDFATAQQKSLLLKNISDNPYVPVLTRDVCRQFFGVDMFCAPEGSAISTFGNHAFLFISDQSWNRVIFMDVLRSAAFDGTYQHTEKFGGFGSGTENLYFPRGLATDNDVNGDTKVNLYMTDTENNRIMRRWARLSFNPTIYTYSFAQAVLTSQLSKPVDVDFSSNGTPTDTLDDYLWVVDQGNHRLVRCKANVYETVLGTYGSFGNGTGQFSSPTGVAAARSFQNPNADLKKIFVSDEGNRRIVELSSSNNWAAINWRVVLQGNESADFTALDVDAYGHLWIVDHGNNQIIKIDPNTGSEIARINGTDAGPCGFNGLHSISTVRGSQAWADLFVTEHWSANSGGRWHRIGVDITNGASLVFDQGPSLSVIDVFYSVTDPGYTDIKVFRKPNSDNTWTLVDGSFVVNQLVSVGTDHRVWGVPSADYGQPYTYKFQVITRSTYQNINGTPVNADTMEILAQPLWQAATLSSAVSVVDTATRITWTDPFVGENGFYVHRKPADSANWTLIATLGANTTTYQDNYRDLRGSEDYQYRVRAFNLTSTSPWSNTITAPKTRPKPPANFAANIVKVTLSPTQKNIPTNKVILTWNIPANQKVPIDSYRVESYFYKWRTVICNCPFCIPYENIWPTFDKSRKKTGTADTLCLQYTDTLYDFYIKSFATLPGNIKDSSVVWVKQQYPPENTLVGPRTGVLTGNHCLCFPCGPDPEPNMDGFAAGGGEQSRATVSSLPKIFALNQNVPNPFNPSTIIRYALPQSVKVELKIYNILGQTVRTLVDEEQAAGFYEKPWDGRDQNGQEMSSGIYLYRIRAGDFVQTKQMQLIK